MVNRRGFFTPYGATCGRRSACAFYEFAGVKPRSRFFFLRFLALLDADHLRPSRIARLNATLTVQALANTLMSNRFYRGFVECRDRRYRNLNSTPFSVSPLASLMSSQSRARTPHFAPTYPKVDALSRCFGSFVHPPSVLLVSHDLPGRRLQYVSRPFRQVGTTFYPC
jgi:hypothetical protein